MLLGWLIGLDMQYAVVPPDGEIIDHPKFGPIGGYVKRRVTVERPQSDYKEGGNVERFVALCWGCYLLAGGIAEQIARREPVADRFDTQFTPDHRQAIRLARKLTGTELILDDAQQIAHETLTRFWPTVLQLSSELSAAGTITGDRVDQLLSEQVLLQ